MRFNRKSFKFYVTIMTLIILASSVGYAGDNPLTILSSVPLDHSTNVELGTDITVEFSNNVVNMSVKDTNMSAFSLKDGNGNDVDFEVIMADDQIDREKRAFITIHPVSPLSERTEYILTISGDLTSKNGNSLGTDQTIQFTTLGVAVSDSEAASVSEETQSSTGLIVVVIIALIFATLYLMRRNKKK